jgi:tRNA (guanine-N7-)-methyltransferase
MNTHRPRVEKKEDDGKRSIKSFVLRTGALSVYQKEALDRYTAQYAVSYKDNLLDPSTIFPRNNPLIIEIGFGMGDVTKRIADEQRDKNFLAIEVFLSGFTKLLDHAGTHHVENLRLIRFDAVSVLNDMIADNSVQGFHIFFPDPWPKKKHHKRRLIQHEFATLLAQKLTPGGYIYCVTDWSEYAHQMVEVFDNVEELINHNRGFCEPVSWRPTTSFEKKGLQKEHEIFEVWVEKKSG